MNNTTEIGAALARLQESLKEIDSAREQVKKVIGTYGQTGTLISEYLEELSNVHSKIVDLINLDKENFRQAEQSVLNISSQCDTVIKNLKAAIEEILQQNREHIDVLQQKYADNLSANNDMFGKIAKSLVEDSRNSIATLKELIANLSTIKSDINSAMRPIDTTITKIDKLSNDFEQEAGKRKESQDETITLLKEFALSQENRDKENRKLLTKYHKNNTIALIIIIIMSFVIAALILTK
ncbi:MAG: hypothetical protein SNJ28_05920 [Rikenellaceae bacterium]